MDLGEDTLHLLQVGAAAAVEAHTSAATLEKTHVETLLEGPDTVGDSRGGHA